MKRYLCKWRLLHRKRNCSGWRWSSFHRNPSQPGKIANADRCYLVVWPLHQTIIYSPLKIKDVHRNNYFITNAILSATIASSQTRASPQQLLHHRLEHLRNNCFITDSSISATITSSQTRASPQQLLHHRLEHLRNNCFITDSSISIANAIGLLRHRTIANAIRLGLRFNPQDCKHCNKVTGECCFGIF